MSATSASSSGSISSDTLDRAIAQSVLTAQQVEMLRYLERTRSAPALAESPDDEKFRFISGFSDIFVTIGLGLFLGATGYFSGSGFVVAAASWLLAEYFTRKSRMALPSIVLLLAFAASVFVGVAGLFDGGEYRGLFHPLLVGWPGFAAASATVAATAIYYWRFRVPVTIAAGMAALVAALMALVHVLGADLAGRLETPFLFLSGLAVFALAMRFDLSDPSRETRRTDIAFWLHMLAAPLIVHPLVGGLVGEDRLDTASALTVLAIFVVLAFIALVVDRRAILVSGLGYAGFAFGSLVVKAGFSDGVVPFTMLVLGALVLLLSAGWRALRRTLLPLLPGGLVRRLPAHT